MANNAIENLINDEIKSLDDALTMHAYHRQVLKSLLEKINSSTGLVSLQPQQSAQHVEQTVSADTDWIPTPNVAQREKRKQKKTFPANGNKRLYISRAVKVARRIRKTKESKTQAIKHLIKVGQIKGVKVTTMQTIISPIFLGKDVHDLIFKGTKYANEK